MYAKGRRPFTHPHRRNYVPAGHLSFNASLFSFSRGVAYSLPPSRYACHLPHVGRLYCTSPANPLSWQSQFVAGFT